MRRLKIPATTMLVVFLLGAGLALGADKKADQKNPPPDATLTLSEGSVAAGIGWSWGKGKLMYQGKTHSFKVDGLSVGEVGVTKAKAKGTVYGLKNLEDFDGVYGAASAEITAQEGKGATVVVNPKGVRIVLTSTTTGASLKVAAEGLKFKLEN